MALDANRTRDFGASPNHRTKTSTRGAAFVEALIVLPVLTLGLCGLLSFQQLYLTRIHTARLARAAVVAHGLAACKGSAPKQWLGNDLGQYQLDLPSVGEGALKGGESETKPYEPFSNATATAPRANHVLERIERAIPGGRELLTSSLDASVTGTMDGSRATGSFDGSRSAERQVQSRSFGSCSDDIRNGSYSEIIETSLEGLSSLF